MTKRFLRLLAAFGVGLAAAELADPHSEIWLIVRFMHHKFWPDPLPTDAPRALLEQ